MKTIIKSKLFLRKGGFKNIFLWEIVSGGNVEYQLVEHLRNKTEKKQVLLGWYKKRIQAFSEFKRVMKRELKGLPYDRMAFD